jgi:hypothetical protein
MVEHHLLVLAAVAGPATAQSVSLVMTSTSASSAKRLTETPGPKMSSWKMGILLWLSKLVDSRYSLAQLAIEGDASAADLSASRIDGLAVEIGGHRGVLRTVP